MTGRTARLLPGFAALGLTVVGTTVEPHRAVAFPLSDASQPSVIAPASAAPSDASDASALARQIQLLNPYAQSVAPGWTITPSLTLQEVFNDNLFQTTNDRRWDLITFVTPGLAIYGDTPRVQVRLNWQPSILLHVENGNQNQIAQNLNAQADVILWPDHLFLDVSGFAGVGATNGLVPGLGFGSYGGGLNGPTGSQYFLNKDNATQYTSFSISPYFLQRFGDYGTLKIAYTLTHSTSSNATPGFLPLPSGTSGSATSQTTNQEVVQYTSGVFLDRLTDVALVDAQEYSSSGNAIPGHNYTATNQVNYLLNRAITLFFVLGYENINYGGSNPLNIDDMVWQVGTTLTPDPRTYISLSYGHQNGENNFNLNATYAITARTTLTASYVSQLGTQLQQLQSQLATTTLNNSGGVVNSQTGQPLFIGNNLLGSPTQLYRSTTATFGSTTQLNRDTISLNAQYVTYSAAGAGASGKSSGYTVTGSWTHLLRDDLILGASGSYGQRWLQDPGGQEHYVAFTTTLSYIISPTLNVSLSYMFYNVNGNGQIQPFYQDLVIASITKTF
jgi:uncharacterized protein (PEP-CTERM system associated)